MLRVYLALVAVLAINAKLSAIDLSDSFETYVAEDGTGAILRSVWKYWDGRDQSHLLKDKAHPRSGTYSVLAKRGDPYAYSDYADFGATADGVRAEVYVYEDLTIDGTDPSKPVTCMLALFGDADNPFALSDYMQLGVVAAPPSSSKTYCIRTRYGDAADAVENRIIDTGVGRKKGAWTKLAIEVDSIAKGGEARFYIDDKQVGTSYRAGAKDGAGNLKPVLLRWVRLGNGTKSYENFWYDDVSVRSN